MPSLVSLAPVQVQHGAATVAFPAHVERDERSQDPPARRHLLPHQPAADWTVLAASAQTTQAQGLV